MEFKKILISDKDINLCEHLRMMFKKENYKPVIATTKDKILTKYKVLEPDIVLVGINIIVSYGWDLFLKIKNNKETPVIILVDKTSTLNVDLALGFNSGDYFIFKPIKFYDMLRDINVIYNKFLYSKSAAPRNVVKKDNVRVDVENYAIYIDNKKIKATPKEVELLYILIIKENELLKKEKILYKVWGYEYLGVSRTVDVHIARLRKKLEPTNFYIETVWGVGYIFRKRQ